MWHQHAINTMLGKHLAGRPPKASQRSITRLDESVADCNDGYSFPVLNCLRFNVG
jgi:hypothetical protein